MLKLAEILCSVLALGLLVQVGSSDPADDLILSRLNLARLSQLRVELRKLDPVTKCGILEQELNSMFGGAISNQSPHGIFGVLASVLDQRQLPFKNNQPVLEDIKMCIDLAESDGIALNSQNLPVQREVIMSPMREPLQAPINPMNNAINEFNAVKSRVKDDGQDLYGPSGNHAMAQADQSINRNLNRIEQTIQDIADDAADGRLDGIKSYPPGAHHMNSFNNDPNHLLQHNMNSVARDVKDMVEDAVDGRLDRVKPGYPAYGGNGVQADPYINEYSTHQSGGPASEYQREIAQQAVERGMNKLKDKLEDIVEDAVDDRLDRVKPRNPAYVGHKVQADPYVNEYSTHHLDGPASEYQREIAQQAVERGMNKLKDKLEDIVEDAADGRLDGRKDLINSYNNPALNNAKRIIRNGVDNIEQNIRTIVDDASDGRIDGYKNGFPVEQGSGYGYVDPHYEELQRQQGALNAKRNIERQVDHLEHHLKNVVDDAADGRIDGIKGGYNHGGPVPPYGMPPMHPDYHQQQPSVDAKRVIEKQIDQMEHHLKDIVDDAADGHIDGINGHMPPYNPYGHHLQDPYAAAPHYDPRQRSYLNDQYHEANRRMDKTVNRMEDAIDDTATLNGHVNGYQSHYGASYINPGVNDLHRQHAMNDAKRVTEGQIDRLEDRMKDIVDDAADGRIDGIKGHMPPYTHNGIPLNLDPNNLYYNSRDGRDRLHGGSHGYSGVYEQGHQHGAHGVGPIDPRTLPSQNEIGHAKRKVERRIDELQDKLHDIVDDAADGRIDGIKNRMGIPNSRHYYGSGYSHNQKHGYPGHYSGHSAGGSISKMLNKGLDKLTHKLHKSSPHGHMGRSSGGYEHAEMLRELHHLMSYNHHDNPMLRCDRFSTLLSSSPQSHDQVKIIARQPLAKLANGRPLAESRPVIQSMLSSYGNLFISSPDSISRGLGSELLRCADMAASSGYHYGSSYLPQSQGHSSGVLQHDAPIYSGNSRSHGRWNTEAGRMQSNSRMLPFEKQLNSRFPTMPAMPTMHY